MMKRLKIAGIAALCGQIAAILFLFVCSLLLTKSNDPFGAAPALTIAAAIVGAVVCGLIAARPKGENSPLDGWIAGGLLLLSTLLLSFLPGRAEAQIVLTVVRLLIEGLLPPLLCILLRSVRGKRSARRHARRRYAGR